MSRTAVIAGVGPGLGESLARKFAAEGCAVGLFARSGDYLDDLAADLRDGGHDALGVPVDLTDRASIADGFRAVREAFGAVDVLVPHASGGGWNGIRETTPESFERAWRTAAYGGFCCAKEAVPAMCDGDGGTVIFTGATSAVRGRAGSLAFSSAKFAVRGLAQSLAQEVGPEGVHVSHVVIDGQLRPPDGPAAGRDADSYLDPADVAETYWQLIEQSPETMSFEVHVTNGTREIEFL